MTTRIIAAFAALSLASAAQAAAARGRIPVLLELFTSEGCSDCPPADQILDTLDHTQPIAGADLIVLSEHVDYWNRLGWSDPWSSPAWSKRQQDYAAHFQLTDIYTPQLVVDGRTQMVGSDRRRISAAIDEAISRPKVPLALSTVRLDGSHITVHITAEPVSHATATLFVGVAENRVSSLVARGENKGRTLQHVAVLRSLVPVGLLKPGKSFAADAVIPVTSNFETGPRIIAFIQDHDSGRVLGVAAITTPSAP